MTEREIGESILDRFVAIYGLRRHLDRVGVQCPLHIFGGLDPLHTPLYLAAGAELFDGLGWLRYAYREGVAMNREASALLDRQITKRWMHSLNSVSIQNLDELRRLTDDLRRFSRKGDWSLLSRGLSLKPIIEVVQERMEAPSGGSRRTGGHLTANDLDELRKEAQQRLAQSHIESEVNSLLHQELTSINDRDVERTNNHLDSIEQALGEKLEHVDQSPFGGSVAKHTYVD